MAAKGSRVNARNIHVDAFTNVPDSLAKGVAEAVEMLAFGLPFVLIAFPLALVAYVVAAGDYTALTQHA